MSNRAIPFRPRLEGAFRTRFYASAARITADAEAESIERLIVAELRWGERESPLNPVQRKRHKAVWMLLRDLLHASWKAAFRDGVLELRLPALDETQDADIPTRKKQLKMWMQESRLERLQGFEKFIAFMEAGNGTRKSVLELVADGRELAERLSQRRKRQGNCRAGSNHETHGTSRKPPVQPRLQLVKENERDIYTNHKLSDIWRYFRLTWSTPAETTPGRTMQYLIRDAAHPNHAVMGIFSLENCAVQVSARDVEIGWNPGDYEFTEKDKKGAIPGFVSCLEKVDNKTARRLFKQLVAYTEEGVVGISSDGLCSAKEVANPSETVVEHLLREAEEAEKLRQLLLKEALKSNEEIEEESELGKISMEVEDALYRRKRAEQLGRLLDAKRQLSGVLESGSFGVSWRRFLDSDKGASAVRTALVAQKSRHIGSSLLELNVCGAVPPYNEILGGKLAALLALAPQVNADYRERYGTAPSQIATRLKGEDVVRPADLVYVGTTSLYTVGSSQYNRLKLPPDVLGAEYGIEWKKLGVTAGFGTLHISKATTAALVEASEDALGFTRINHVFGEGASPKLRIVNEAIRSLLETNQEDARDLARHAMARIVYGACVAKNAKQYLLGLDERPKFYFSKKDAEEKTQAIIAFWQKRWMEGRLSFAPAMERVRAFKPESLKVSQFLKADTYEKEHQPEEETMTASQPSASDDGGKLDFLRNLYRGSSAYADNLAADKLKTLHIETKLDQAVLDAVEVGKDVVLTGNPGDGKTHIIRILQGRLDKLPTQPIVELDASCLTDDEIFTEWQDTRKKKRPFVLAINGAVLLTLGQNHPKFQPVASAWVQVENAVGMADADDAGVVVFDLNRREVLEKDVVAAAIEKITADEFYTKCKTCAVVKTCPVTHHRNQMRNTLFQERLNVLLERVALKGQHVSLRELLSFLSFLLFGGRSCDELLKTSGDDKFGLVSRIYTDGEGAVFEYVRDSFDPAAVSHPHWDEKLLAAQVVDGWEEKKTFGVSEAVDETNTERFILKKRQFFFFNKHGKVLVDICDDDASRFQQFLAKKDKECVKDLLGKLNAFFGAGRDQTKVEMWNGFRFNHAVRKVLVSAWRVAQGKFEIVRPALSVTMAKGISATCRFVFLCLKETGVHLKVDYELFRLLSDAERGIPMLLVESDATRRVWRFIEQLQVSTGDDKEELQVTLLDLDERREVRVSIDREDKCYTAIETQKVKL